MKIKKIITTTAKVLGYIIFGLILLTVGVIIGLYSPWTQESLRTKIIERMNMRPGVEMSLDRLSLRFPLELSLGGLCVAYEGDTLIAAGNLDADVAIRPLMAGRVEADRLRLDDGRYTMGSPDSAMYMVIDASQLDIGPVKVGLKDMDIDISRGLIAGGSVNMTLNPDTTAAKSAPADSTTMSIRLGQLNLENFTYRMKMLPTIDSLGASIAHASLDSGLIDLKSQQIRLRSFTGTALDAAYIAPDSATIAATPVVASTDTAAATAPWTIEIDSIGFADSRALYTTRGIVPAPGLDFTYIELDSVDLGVRHFYNQATTLRLPVNVSGVERCGVRLKAAGTFSLDSAAMRLDDFTLSTPVTKLDFNALMGMGNITADPQLPVKLDVTGGVGVDDLRKMFPAFLPYLLTLPANDDIKINLFADGSMSRLELRHFDMAVNRCVNLKAKGYLTNLTDPAALGGDVALSGNIINVTGIKNELLDKTTAKSVNIPPMSLNGRVKMLAGTVSGNLKAVTGGGSIALDGRWNSRGQDYQAAVKADSFPVMTFMPLLGVGRVTATLDAKGHGYDPFSKTMKADADLNVSLAQYGGYDYRDIKATIALAEGKARLQLNSDNPATKLQLMAEGNLDGKTYDWTVIADGNNIDLQAIRMSDVESLLSFNISGRAVMTPSTQDYDATLTVNDFNYHTPTSRIDLSNIDTHLSASDSLTRVTIDNRDFHASLTSLNALDSLIADCGMLSDSLAVQLKDHKLDVGRLQAVSPRFELQADGGDNNFINDILSSSKTSIRSLSINAANDSIMHMSGRVLGLKTATTALDTITVGLKQHKSHLDLNAHIGNRPGTLDQWAQVDVKGILTDRRAGLRLTQHNIAGRMGFDLGVKAAIADSTLTLNIVPYTPVIGYKDWTVNDNNFISYNFPTKHIDASLDMKGADSRLQIYTEHVDGASEQEDLFIKLSDIHLADWISFNPFMPQVKGDLSADIRLNRNPSGDINGKGTMSLEDFFYGKQRVASLKADFDVTTRPGGTLYATSDVYVDGAKTMTLAGALNDSTMTSPFNLDFSMIRFPLATVNPFMPVGTAKLSGVLNGQLKISGDSKAPILNGWLDFDSTAVRLAMTGTDYRFSEVKIPVVDNLVTFDNFAINGVNKNPLTVNGTVDLRSLSSPDIDLTLKADNMQIINNIRRAKGADLYGRAFISLDSHIRGNMSLLFVKASLGIMPQTNVTYVMPEAVSAIRSYGNSDMVKFVNFADTTAVANADSISSESLAMVLDASLTINNGSTIGVDLSSDGKNRVQLQSNGTLNFNMSPLQSDGRLTGRININDGYIRYSLPVISEKHFTFKNNSYVAFNGDMMNPTLSVHAVDVMKANVTQQGQNSRLVDFDVALNVTGTLNNMDVAFDLSTNDDATVQNELQSMSPDQRANQAMNLLLYGIYTGPGTKGDTSLGGNALYSFLESQINSWAAKTIKGVDLSFGINQYDRTVDGASSQTTSYSYQVSKSLFNDRIKIVVGGNYSTDANADENFSQNLINDISFEYFINRAHTMYIRIFRHTGYESILEGEITQTGVGFVYRRKLDRLSDMFKFSKAKKNAETEN